MVEEEAEVEVVAGEEALEAELSLNQQRLQVVLQTLKAERGQTGARFGLW